MLAQYREHAAERAVLGIPPLPLSAEQVEQLVNLLREPSTMSNIHGTSPCFSRYAALIV